MKVQEYDPMKIPKLFTELNPAEIDADLDSEDNQLSPFDAYRKEIWRRLIDDDEVEDGQEMRVSAPMPEGEFKLSREFYKRLLKQCKNGDVTYVKLEKKDEMTQHQTNVIFFGANFDNEFPAKNLYKALNVARPDLVMVQMSPDFLLSNFK